ncbi:hypothetical protein Tco_0853117 [Tanacetum coccineum]
MVEKDEYNKLSKRFYELEQHCISLEIAMQLNKEFFQKNNTSVIQLDLICQLFELNNLKVELQEKDTTIEKLKANIKCLNKTSTTNNVKKDIDEIETINIELEHRVTKLIAENEHLKQTYKQLFDSIKPSVFMVKNNKDAHEYYLKHTMEQAAILREIVEQAKSLNPLDSASYSALFDEFFSPSASVASPIPVEEAPAPVELTEESHDLEVAHMSNNLYFGIPILETVSEESLSPDVIPAIMHSDAPILEHLMISAVTGHSTIPIEDGDPEAEHKMCIKYASDANSASDDDTPVNLHGVVDWELLPTGLGWVNVIYKKDNSQKCFSRLREILHLVTRTNLMIIYSQVMTFYQDKEATGVGLVLWGDLKVLIDSPEVNDGSDVWKNQNTWIIQSWKLYSSTGIHVLETVSGLVLHMFVDKRYPLSVNLIERMLDNQLEICRDTVGNELTTAVQLIAFLKKQISDSRRPKLVAIRLELIEVWFQFPVASPEQTATSKDTSNPLMAVMTCQKSYSSSTYYDSFQVSMLIFLLLIRRLMTVAFGAGFQDVAVQSSGDFNERSI